MHTCANTVHKHTSSYTNHTPRVPTKAKGELGGLQAKEEEQPYDPVLFDPMRCEQPAACACGSLSANCSNNDATLPDSRERERVMSVEHVV